MLSTVHSLFSHPPKPLLLPPRPLRQSHVTLFRTMGAPQRVVAAAAATLSTGTRERVKIVEVGPRDGLQNEAWVLNTETKVELVERLVQAGCRWIEVGSFVSPARVPQMANTLDVIRQVRGLGGARFAALVPNMRGMAQAVEAEADEVAIFAAATETFSQKNIGCSIQESFVRFRDVMQAAKQAKVPVRGYVSCIVGCPYEGAVEPSKVTEVAEELYKMGCYEISLGDTIGVGTPASVLKLLQHVSRAVPLAHLALHCHDTYGQALANILVGLQHGVRTFDCSVAGLGGCPYAPGASGNVATEDVVYMLHGMGFDTGIRLPILAKTGEWIARRLEKGYTSKAGFATLRKSKSAEVGEEKAKL